MTEPGMAPFPHAKVAKRLQALVPAHEKLSLNHLLATDADRLEQYSLSAAGWHLDYSRQLLNNAARTQLFALAHAAGLDRARAALFDGSPLNHTENRAVLHTVLRARQADAAVTAQWRAVQDCRRRMADWVNRVHRGEHCGYTGARITDVVNLGIGGSDLGPRMVVQALQPLHHAALRVHFCANVDPAELHITLRQLRPEQTLFIICSKSLRTEETLHNAASARRWLLADGADNAALAKHFLAVSTNVQAAADFGIPADNVLPLWDWVGGRYSLWSAIGWSIGFAVGNRHFDALLAGAEAMDRHFRHTPPEHNMPVLLSLLEIWQVNFLNAQSHAVIPYHHNLRRLPAFLQQLSMESNGKRVNREGRGLGYATAPVLWGDEGSNGQHSFHQLLHQGTPNCPLDFIVPLQALHEIDRTGQQHLVANCYAQGQALLQGRDLASCFGALLAQGYSDEEADRLAPHWVVPGNRSTSTLSCTALTPENLGSLIALYEHKTFCSGQIWQINSFDQWGVELGKELGDKIYQAMQENISPDTVSQTGSFDASTNALLRRWRDSKRTPTG